jgi:hypothetical protein
MAFMDGFFLDGFRNRLENKICRRFFFETVCKKFIMDDLTKPFIKFHKVL